MMTPGFRDAETEWLFRWENGVADDVEIVDYQ
jgi:hypothetical protein